MAKIRKTGWATLAVVASLSTGPGCEPQLADLIVSLMTVPAAVEPGQQFLYQEKICNQGTLPADPVEVDYWLRQVEPPHTALDIGHRMLPPLEPGACDEASSWLPAPPALPYGAYEVLTVVDSEHLVPDPRPMNNMGVSDVLGYGWGHDLIVEALTGPPNVDKHASFDVQARVCNRGTSPSPLFSNVDIHLSTDATIDGFFPPPLPPAQPDPMAGSLSVPELPPGACLTIADEVNASVYAEGPHYLGAIVHGPSPPQELVESNNTYTGALMGVGYGPDLVVRELAGPPSVMPWSSFDLDFTVCNQGTGPSTSAYLDAYFSADTRIDPAFPDPAAGDPQIGSFFVPGLAPGQCHSEQVSTNANVPDPGAWFLGAIVDPWDDVPELLESNNDFAGALTGVGYGSDLLPVSIGAPRSVETGASFDVSVDVCNRGTADSADTELRVFLSDDTTLQAGPEGSDPEIGNLPVPSLLAGECRQEIVSANAWMPEDGAWFLIAKADALDDDMELIETNNAKVGPKLGVGYASDLVVTALSGPPSTWNNDPFDVTATVCNFGTQPSWERPVDLGLYLSLDTTIEGDMAGPGPLPGSDPHAGSIPVPELEPGACVQVQGEGWAGVEGDGAYYLGAIVDEIDNAFELDEGNNTFTGGVIGVGQGPDLRIESLSGPASALPGTSIALDYEVCNRGTSSTYETSDVRFYTSADASIEGSLGIPFEIDTFLGMAPVPMLTEGECHAGTEFVTLPTGGLGLHFLGAIVDEAQSVFELVETNNEHVGGQLAVGADADFVLRSVSGPPSAPEGGSFDVDVEVCNQGTIPSTPTMISIFLTEDTEIEGWHTPPGDPHVGDLYVTPLAPGECRVESDTTWGLFGLVGEWFLAAIVNEGNYEPELRYDNNDLLGAVMGVGNGPDLIVASLTADPSVENGGSLGVEVELCNQGTDFAAWADAMVYLSQDAVITSASGNPVSPDMPLGPVSLPGGLPPGACDTVVSSVPVFPPSDGPWVVGAIVDDTDDLTELIESNNALAGPVVGVGHAADLVVSSLVAPASVPYGVSFSLDFEVCNQGTAWSSDTPFSAYYTEDAVIDGQWGGTPFSDPVLWAESIPPLAPGACHPGNVLAWAYPDEPGQGFVAATVDEPDQVFELIETNNELLGAPLEVTPGP